MPRFYASVSHPAKGLLPFCDGDWRSMPVKLKLAKPASCLQRYQAFCAAAPWTYLELSDNGHRSLRWMTVAKSGLLSLEELGIRPGLNEILRDTG
jgi:hypothetical protein